jgi:sec-independent protein translocase protein TatA
MSTHELHEPVQRAIFGLGATELIIILAIVLLVFGAGKLPQVGDALGKSIKNFKKASSARDEEAVDVTPKNLEPPASTPVQTVDVETHTSASPKT